MILNEVTLRPDLLNKNQEKACLRLFSADQDSKYDSDGYFKIYNAPSRDAAEFVWRVYFKEAAFVKKHKGDKKALTSMTSEQKKILNEILDMPTKKDKKYSLWSELKFYWNQKMNKIKANDTIDDYVSGKLDDIYKPFDNYLPFFMTRPDYTQMRNF